MLVEQPGDRGRPEVLTTTLALGARELLHEVPIRAPENVSGFLRILAEPDLRHRLDEGAHQFGRQRRTGVDAGQHIAEVRVLRSIALRASSIRRAISGCDAAARSASQRAPSGTQNTFLAKYSSRVGCVNPCGVPIFDRAWF